MIRFLMSVVRDAFASGGSGLVGPIEIVRFIRLMAASRLFRSSRQEEHTVSSRNSKKVTWGFRNSIVYQTISRSDVRRYFHLARWMRKEVVLIKESEKGEWRRIEGIIGIIRSMALSLNFLKERAVL